MNGLQLLCKYEYWPNRLGYYGPQNAHKKMLDYINEADENIEAELKEIMQQFPSYAFLKLIAEKNSRDVFDLEVVEAYWIGNNLLENVTIDDLRQLILNLGKEELLEKNSAENKANSIKLTAKAHRSFHVLHVGGLSPKFKNESEAITKALVSWGKVRRLIREGQEILASTTTVRQESTTNYVFADEEKRISAGFVFSVEKKDFVTIHWKTAIQKISDAQVDMLKKYTLANLQK